MSQGTHQAKQSTLILGALGVVFGDIGTSPLYALKESLHAAGGLKATNDDVYGILSLIVWSLMMVVTFKYLVYIMRADNNGEGGIFALLAVIPEEMRPGRHGRLSTIALIGVIGAALLYGDGAITPAISVLSAVEGLKVASDVFTPIVLPLTVGILICLFWFQYKGTAVVGKLFGPVMVLWFGTLAVLGIYHIQHDPQIFQALWPTWALLYFQNHGWHSLHVLGSVVLAVTGGEALYADMGHFGIRPIRRAWLFCVLPALLLGYFGQGALILRNHEAIENPFFSMVPAGPAMYALVVLASFATIIASQALISGAFSLTRQAMQLGYFPRMTVKHTAHDSEGQIYIPEINYLLGIACILLVLAFRESTRLAAAYGIAVTGTMLLTSILYFFAMRYTWEWPLRKVLPIFLLFLAFDIPFLVANLLKFFDGGYVPILIAGAFTTAMVLWYRGRSYIMLHRKRRFTSFEAAMEKVTERLEIRTPGTAVFMDSGAAWLPPILVHHVERTRSLHENVILLNVTIARRPYVKVEERWQWTPMENGFHRLVMRYGFMEDPIVPNILVEAAHKNGLELDCNEITYYLGRENVMALPGGFMGEFSESIFAFLHRNATPADRHFDIPHRQVIEIGTQVNL
jgi:KUP system potassium uptake protein